MADVPSRHAMFPEEIFFKRENAQQPVDGAAYQRQSPFPPGPGLRRDQVDNGNPLALEPPGDAQMEIGRIGEDRKPWVARAGGSNQFPVLAPDARQMPEHLDQPHYRQALGLNDRLDTRSPHPRPRAPEEMRIRPEAPQLANQQSGVAVARNLSGRNQNLAGHLLAV